MSELRDAACLYASWNWKIHPLWPKSKAPATKNGKNDATCDLGQVFKWWEIDYNIGINCRESGLVVIDVDGRHGGDDTLWEITNELGEGPDTMEALTPGGVHLYFRHPGVPLKGKLGPGIDIKDCGYVVAPPSVHPSGEQYWWELNGPSAPAVLPAKWLARMSRESHVSAPLTPSNKPLGQIPATEYVPALTGRVPVDGWVTCPFHSAGAERTPSFKVNGPLWACFGACEPWGHKQVAGGNIVDFAAKVKGYPVPLSGADLAKVLKDLELMFLGPD